MGNGWDATSSSRWLSISRRDPKANSAFLYGAISTRIFCRPTCPGRLARRSNVVFFDCQLEAFEAGYRPCKRCQPCNHGWDRDVQSRVLAMRARDMIVCAVTSGTPWTVESLALELNISGAHLHRQFKKFLGVTPKAFAASLACEAFLQCASKSPGPVAVCPGSTSEQSKGPSHSIDASLDWLVSQETEAEAGVSLRSDPVSEVSTGEDAAMGESASTPWSTWDFDVLQLIDFDGLSWDAA